MKRSTYFVLGGIALVLIVAYYFVRPTQREEATYQAPDIQLSLNIAKVVKVEIERNREYMRMERLQGFWKITEPIHYTVDDEAIYKLLEGMARFKLLGLVSSNTQKQDMFQVGEKGTKLTVTYDDGKSATLIIGKAGPTPKQVYVRPVSSTSVYLARGLVPTIVNLELREWRQRTIYRTDPLNIKLLSVRDEERKFTVRKDKNKWISGGKVVPGKIIQPPLSTLCYLRAEDFVDTAFILTSSPRFSVEMLANELIRLEFYIRGQQSLLKTSLSPGIYIVNKSITDELTKLADELVTPPPVVTVEQPPPTPVIILPKPQPAAKDTEITAEAQQVLMSLAVQATAGNETAAEPEHGELVVYTVLRGETMDLLAKKFKVTKEKIVKWNLLKNEDIKPGMDLYIFTTVKLK